MCLVKKIILILLISLNGKASYGQNHEISREIIISKGQHYEFSLPFLEQFSVGNPEIISHKYLENKKGLIIKGKKIGHSEIIFWKKDKTREKWQIYVLSKQKQLNIYQIKKLFMKLGLQTWIIGEYIKIEGTLTNISDYYLIKKFHSQLEKNTYLHVNLSKKVRNSIMGHIYSILSKEQTPYVHCYPKFLDIYCQYDDKYPINNKLKKILEKKYYIIFLPLKLKKNTKNYQIKFKIVQTESQTGDHFSLGLNSIVPIHSFFTHSLTSHLKKREDILWENQKIKVSTLAEPQTLIKDGGQATIQLGADIPFVGDNSHNEHLGIKWRFAGLKIKLKLDKYGEHHELQYETELTGPIEKSISGTKGKAQVFLRLKKPIQLFEIGFKTKSFSKKGVPFIKDIPFLGKLFTSSSKQNSFKKIHGIVQLEEYEN